MQKTLGKYGIIYKNYLKEYKLEMYQKLKDNNSLLDHCYEREQELNQLYETIEKQLREINPKPNTTSFIELAQYENKIVSIANEFVIDNIAY